MGDELLARDLAERGISDPRVLAAIAALSRAEFVPETAWGEATANYPLPIGHGQTISQPYVVAFMSQALGLKGAERVLEIGTGSGYQTAVLAQLAAEVYSIEILSPLAEQAAERLSSYPNVHLRQGDGHFGWREASPFDAILLTAAPPRLPDELIAQLSRDGRLVAPVGGDDTQELVRLTRSAQGELEVERLLGVRFVPMTRQMPSG